MRDFAKRRFLNLSWPANAGHPGAARTALAAIGVIFPNGDGGVGFTWVARICGP